MPPTNTPNSTAPSTAASGLSQEELLKKAKADVRTNALQMKKQLDSGQLLESIKYASSMLNELCTSNLSPKSYYELYMNVTDELRHLEMYMVDEFQKGFKCDDLYELVQYASAIIPRLYLLITVGTVYIKIKEYPRRIILKDLVEMCRGVQHPLRGLFLRNYLLQCTKNLLPDVETSSPYGATSNTNSELNNFEDGCISDSIDFILLNFSEMNKLWVRMQYQGHTRQKEKREQERKELRLLVGTNLVRLSQLECINVELYNNLVLPKILEQVVNCNDAIAQEYLMECIIQVFPDEFHILTLEAYLKSCCDLHEDVNIKNIIISLAERFTKNSKAKYEESLFDTFSKQISSIITSRPNMPVQDIVAIYTGLINLSIKAYENNNAYVDKVLESTETILNNMNLDHIQTNTPLSKEIIKMLKIPVELYKNILVILNLKHYSSLYEHLDYVGRKLICQHLINNALENENLISTPEDVELLLQLINPLIQDPADKPVDYEQDNEDFIDEQTLVSKLLHLMYTDNLDQQYLILNKAKGCFANSGKDRMQYTLPPIVFEAYRLAFRYKQDSENDEKWDKKCDKIFRMCFQIINSLIKAEIPAELAFKLFLEGSIALAEISYDNSENITYEFLTQAIDLYDNDITTNKYQAITLIIATCQKILHVFGDENCDALKQNCVTRAAKILKKPDQCRAVALCSHLFWNCKDRKDGTSLKDGQKVSDCLRKCIKISSQCVDLSAQFELNVEILNNYVYYYENKNTHITLDMIKELIAKIKTDQSSIDKTSDAQLVFGNFERTIKYINSKLNESF